MKTLALNHLPRNLGNRESSNITQKFMSAVMVLLLLFTFVSHSDHLYIANDGAEQRCHFCQHSIDNVKSTVDVNLIEQSVQYIYNEPLFFIDIQTKFFVTPSLRAPPIY